MSRSIRPRGVRGPRDEGGPADRTAPIGQRADSAVRGGRGVPPQARGRAGRPRGAGAADAGRAAGGARAAVARRRRRTPIAPNWDAPYIISPHNPRRLYWASQFVYRSDDRGDNWTRSARISRAT